MRQKYELIKNIQNRQIIIRESAELDKDTMALLCEEIYDTEDINQAISSGEDALVAALRTKNLYPPGIYAERIAAALRDLCASEDKEQVELFFDDIEILTKELESKESIENPEDDIADSEGDG
jgi:hypothetical protein